MIHNFLIAITILTWNTARMGMFAKPEHNKVLQYLSAQDADIVCLQEVDVYKDSRYLTLGEVKREMGKKYPYSYLDFSVYDKRHQFGTMVWSKYPLINKQSIHYANSTSNLSNMCDVVVGDDTIRLFNNHLESYSFKSEDLEKIDLLRIKWERALPLRNKQAQVVRSAIEASPYPVVVVGDFNSIALSFVYLYMTRGLVDAWRTVHPFSWGATCEKRGFGLRIDYILSSPKLRPTACEVIDAKGSDHKPVRATLSW